MVASCIYAVCWSWQLSCSQVFTAAAGNLGGWMEVPCLSILQQLCYQR